MHQKYAGKGFTMISVSLDPLFEGDKRVDAAGEAEVRAEVEKFLVKNKATFTNLILDEPTPFWTKKFGFAAPPCLYVFDRRGKWVRFDSDVNKIDHDDVEKLVVKLLAE